MAHEQVPVMRNVTLVNNTVTGGIILSGWGSRSNPASLVVANNVVYGQSIRNRPAAAIFAANLEYTSATAGIFINPSARNYWPAVASPLLGAAHPDYTPLRDFNGAVRSSPSEIGAYATGGLAANPGWRIVSGFKVVATDAPPNAPKNLLVR